MIVLDGVGKSFGDKRAVNNLSLNVPAGEVFGLLGPNAAGKTTVIKMMTALLIPAEGRITIRGHDVLKQPEKAKSVTGYVPDRAFFYEKLTVREHLSFVASIYGLKKERAISRIEELLETFGIKDIEDAFIEGCSQGMRQRLLFAAALIHEPEVLLIDEPFVGLDPFGVLLIKDMLKNLSASGVSVFLATHSLHIAAELCHRVGLIDRGNLIALKDRKDITDEKGGLESFFIRTLQGVNDPLPR